ncbi:unnamed protein product, partial [Tetraodon nigroviridis]
QAGASSMWASCCGLLNEVMGTGTVRAQQPGFGAGAGPFRFAPSAGYSTYPPTSSGSAAQLCKACGLAFSVFRRKHICCDCKKSFCALCSVLQENLRCCATCHLLRGTAFQRPRLMQLRVKDLRQYLLLRNIPTDTCREKEDLVDLVLCHRGMRESPRPVQEEEEEETAEEEEEAQAVEEGGGGGQPQRQLRDPQPAREYFISKHERLKGCRQKGTGMNSGAVSPPTGARGRVYSVPSEPGANGKHPGGENDPVLASQSVWNLMRPGVRVCVRYGFQVSPATQRRIRASLSDLDTEEAIENLSVRQLKEILARNFVNYSGCCEKWELLERVHRLYRENEQNRKSMENVSITAADGVKAQLAADENLCRICMDAIIDCVLLECGHMVTCTKCGKRMSECPICRQYVVRAVHVFRS